MADLRWIWDLEVKPALDKGRLEGGIDALADAIFQVSRLVHRESSNVGCIDALA